MGNIRIDASSRRYFDTSDDTCGVSRWRPLWAVRPRRIDVDQRSRGGALQSRDP